MTKPMKFATDKDFDHIMKPFLNDSRTKRIYKNPIVRRETVGNYNDVLRVKNTYVKDFKKKISTYGSNHIYQMAEYIPKDARILELAAANGWASAILRDMGFKNILVTDINPFDYTGLGGIRRFTEHTMKTRLMSFEDIDLPKRSFDVVFMCSSLHHSSHVNKVASQVHDVLKRSGKWFIIGEPVRGLFDLKNMNMLSCNKDGFNDHYYYWWQYRRWIRRAGFRIEVLFPVEFHKMLSGEIKEDSARKYKKVLLSFAKSIYSIGIGKRFIRWIYPVSLYFLGSYAIIKCEKL